MFDPYIGVNSSLVNAEQELVRVDRPVQAVKSLHLFFAPVQPPRCARDGSLHIVPLRVAGRALVESHGYRGSKMRLDPHALLGPHEDPGPVYMRVEGHALFLDLAQVSQGEDLKSS